MPLAPASPRKLIHTRRIECNGYQREDGLWDVEGHIRDTKSYSYSAGWRDHVAAGEPVHDMWVRLTLSDDLVVQDAVAVTDASPYPMCVNANTRLSELKGLKIQAGWTNECKRRLGGTKGCTHVMELLGPVATTAYQTLVILRREQPDKLRPDGTPVKINTCYAYADDNELVKERWPAFYKPPHD